MPLPSIIFLNYSNAIAYPKLVTASMAINSNIEVESLEEKNLEESFNQEYKYSKEEVG